MLPWVYVVSSIHRVPSCIFRKIRNWKEIRDSESSSKGEEQYDVNAIPQSLKIPSARLASTTPFGSGRVPLSRGSPAKKRTDHKSPDFRNMLGVSYSPFNEYGQDVKSGKPCSADLGRSIQCILKGATARIRHSKRKLLLA